MKARRIATIAGLALLLGGCGHPGGMGWGGPAGGGGPAMMGGAAGPGVMGGSHGMGMMGSPGAMWFGLERLDLSPEQRARIAAIHDELHRSHSGAMQAMHAQAAPHARWGDEAGERRHFEQMSAMHKQMFESHLDARRRILEVLTPAQRQRLTAGKPGG